MEKTLKYSVHVYGELEKALECQLGTYYVDLERRLFFFESNDKNISYDTAVKIVEVIAKIAVSTHNEVANLAFYIHEKFDLLDEKDVQKKGDKFIYDFKIKGEMVKVVKTKVGSLYADKKNQAYYFDFLHKGFMEPLLKKNFYRCVKEDLDSEDSERQLGAQCVMSILKDWTELDDETSSERNLVINKN